MSRQTALVDLAGKSFAVIFVVSPADLTTGLAASIEPEYVFWEKDGIRDGEDWYTFFEKLDIWKNVEEQIWKQLEGDPT